MQHIWGDGCGEPDAQSLQEEVPGLLLLAFTDEVGHLWHQPSAHHERDSSQDQRDRPCWRAYPCSENPRAQQRGRTITLRISVHNVGAKVSEHLHRRADKGANYARLIHVSAVQRQS